MPVVLFYQFTDQPPESLLPQLARKVLGQGLRMALRGPDRERMEELDRVLWEGEGFLPHGLAGEPHEAEQPILLTWDARSASELPNRPACLVALDGVEISEAELAGWERICVFFRAPRPQDERDYGYGGAEEVDDRALKLARAQWKRFRDLDLPLEYWNREGGGWQRQHQHVPKSPAAPEA